MFDNLNSVLLDIYKEVRFVGGMNSSKMQEVEMVSAYDTFLLNGLILGLSHVFIVLRKNSEFLKFFWRAGNQILYTQHFNLSEQCLSGL